MTAGTNDWLLELKALGALNAAEQALWEERIRQLPQGLSELEQVRVSNREILDRYPVASESERILERWAQQRRSPAHRTVRRSIFAPAWRLAVTCSLLFGVSALLFHFQFRQTPPSAVRLKGAAGSGVAQPQLRVYRRSGAQGGELLLPGTAIAAGDILQLSYHAGSFRYGVIFSIDGNGGVTLHFPYRESEPTILQRFAWIQLKNANKIDNAPLFERFFFITANDVPAVPLILEKARQLVQNPQRATRDFLDLPKTWLQQAQTFGKRQ